MKIKIVSGILFVLAVAAVVSSFAKEQEYRADMPKKARILFVGDMMFDRTIRTIAENRGYDYLFSCIREYLRGFDLVIGNLEGPITKSDSLSRGTRPGDVGNTSFTFDPRVSEALADHNIKMVNLGNNHILDFGDVGRDSTLRELREAGVSFFGAPGSPKVATTTVRGMEIAVINFNQFLGEGNSNAVMEAIWKAKRSSGAVFIYAHWGDEYASSTAYQKALAHSFVDAGADMVIGSHPHVIQEREAYKGRPIYYSLGNFIFDQYWEESVRTGAGVEAEIGTDLVIDKEVRFDIRRDGTVCLMGS